MQMGKSSESKDTRPKRPFIVSAILVMILLPVGLATWHFVSPRTSPIDYLLLPEALPSVPRSQGPATLDPALFTGDVAEAYRVARDRPELLEQMPCYCGCYVTQGHQNLLDCFGDRHPETCPTCVAIALRAARLAKVGYSPADIKRLIDREYASGKSEGRR
jgi:hypothetical protein